MVAFVLRLNIYWMGKASIFRFPFGDSVVAGPDGEFEFPDVPPQQGLFTKFIAVLDTSAASLAAKLPTRVQDTVLSSKLREEAINKVMTDRSREDPDFDPQQYLDHRNTPVGQRAFESLKAKAEGKERVIVFNNCGHGLLDLAAYETFLSGRLEDLELAQGKIEAALGDLPKP